MSRDLVLSRAELRNIAEKSGADSPLRAIAGKGGRAKPRDLEHPEQVKLFEWRFQNETIYPELRLLYAIPNFSGRGGTQRQRMRDGARLKAEGRRKGMLDICLPIARRGFNALYLELKAEGYPSVDQRWWLTHLREERNRAEFVRGFEAARDLMLDYLAGEPTR